MIDEILSADLEAPRKQRHTATRIFHQLLDEHAMTKVYQVVRGYVARRLPRSGASRVAVGVLGGGLIAGLAFQTADDTPRPAGQPTQREPSQTPEVPQMTKMSTVRSQALAAQLALLAPEVTRVAGAVRNDAEELKSDGTPRGWLWAGVRWEYPASPAGTNSVDLTVEVATGNETVPTVCDGMDGPLENRCSEVRALADGSTAYILDSAVAGGHQYAVRIVRPNGTKVFVFAGAQIPPGSTHDSVIGRNRVVQIAQQITVAP